MYAGPHLIGELIAIRSIAILTSLLIEHAEWHVGTRLQMRERWGAGWARLAGRLERRGWLARRMCWRDVDGGARWGVHGITIVQKVSRLLVERHFLTERQQKAPTVCFEGSDRRRHGSKFFDFSIFFIFYF